MEGVRKLKINIIFVVRNAALVEEAVRHDRDFCSSNPDDIWYQVDEEVKSSTGSVQPTAIAVIEIDKYLNIDQTFIFFLYYGKT